jgi:hypothetical protein
VLVRPREHYPTGALSAGTLRPSGRAWRILNRHSQQVTFAYQFNRVTAITYPNFPANNVEPATPNETPIVLDNRLHTPAT